MDIQNMNNLPYLRKNIISDELSPKIKKSRLGKDGK